MGDEKSEAQQKEMEGKILEWAKSYANERGWKLNPDKKQLGAVIRGLARNWLKHGEKYCPCRVRSGDAQIDREIICPCIYHEDEVNNGGQCHCRLFFRETSETSE
jgi:ferredoxin-thioredoxin reductase catalytic chain